MIKVEHLNKSFGNLHVLKDVSLQVEKGEIFGLIGKSGEGKSTLLRCINLLEEKDSGSISIKGNVVELKKSREIRQYRKGIGMIFQHFALLERQNVYKNIAAPMECWKYSKEEIDTKVRELAQIVGIEDKLYEKPRNLSGGQRQRVAIARALSLEPEILLSDEATSALDPKTTKSILQLLRDINERLGITILLVTHEMEVIRSICHRVAIMEDGRIADCGNVSEIFLNQPDSLKRLLGDESEILPAEGVTLRIIFKETLKNRALIPDITAETQAKFSVLYSRLEKFRDEVICTAMLNVKQQDSDKIGRYLDSLKIKWEVVGHE